jgi:hypothetical protein
MEGNPSTADYNLAAPEHDVSHDGDQGRPQRWSTLMLS